jgi:hypothetical protein
MRRIAIVTACVAALLAMPALGAALAQAEGAPEWYECNKEKGVGTYEKGCSKEGGKGGYSANPGVGSGSFVVQGKGKATLRSPSSSRTIVCAHFSIRGQKTMPNLLTGVTLTLTLCARGIDKKAHCESQEEGGPKEKGIIESNTLKGELGYISHSPLRVGLKLSSESEPGLVAIPRIYCLGLDHQRFSGTFVGELGGAVNTSNKHATMSYLPGPYRGEVEPGVTPLVDPPLEGESAGAFIEEQEVTGVWGSPLFGAVEAAGKVTGTQMIKA